MGMKFPCSNQHTDFHPEKLKKVRRALDHNRLKKVKRLQAMTEEHKLEDE